ncbi:MAG: DUF481 domain-containing protein [Desulfuromonadaceae bacterium]|nr:DUF481 domain-containing protein [Desulfuromonadaceae bacterium]
MRNSSSSLLEAAVLFKHGMRRVKMGLIAMGSVLILAAAGMFGVPIAGASGEEAKLTPEYIQKTYPDLYREIQNGPRLPPPEVDPAKPYDPYPGFFAQPVLKPGQIEEWWETSSFEYSPVYPYLLKHTHLKFSYSESTGNDKGYLYKGAFYLALRKGRITNVFAYEADRKSVHSSDGSNIDKNIMGVEDTLSYEFNRYLFVEGGMHWQKLTPQMIENRYIPFVGIGSYNLLQDILNKKKDRLKFNLGFGRVMDEYSTFVVDLTNKKSDSFNAIYTKAEYAHKFNDMLTYKQDFVLKHALDATSIYILNSVDKAVLIGSTKRYDWSWTNSLEFALNQYVGCLVSYNVAFDSNPGPSVEKRDTTFLVGLKFAY